MNLKMWTQFIKSHDRLLFDNAFSVVCFCSVKAIQVFFTEVTFNFLEMNSHVVRFDFLRKE